MLTFNPSLYIYYNISLYICQVEYTMKGPDYIHKNIVHTRTTVVVSLHRIDILTCSATTVKYRRTETLSNSIPSRAGSAVVGADIQVRPPMFLGSPSCALQHVRFPCVNNLTGSTQPVKCFFSVFLVKYSGIILFLP